jgi:mycothiol synthase
MSDVAFPAGWTTRRPTLDDLPEILALVQASDVASVGSPESSADGVRAALAGSPHTDAARDMWLAYAPDGTLAGWAYIENENGAAEDWVEVYTHPRAGRPAMAPLLERILHRVSERAGELGHARMRVRAGALPGEQAYQDSLKAAGFGFVKRYARMRRSLDGLEPARALPPGVVIRLVRHEDDADMRTFHHILDTAFRDTPDYAPRSYERWREWVDEQASVAWDEWFVAEVDGEPAGILMSSDQALGQNEGWVKSLAVLRGFRRRGLGEALLGQAFAVYAAKGRALAGLGVDLANPTEAARLYLGQGMKPRYEADILERDVQAG